MSRGFARVIIISLIAVATGLFVFLRHTWHDGTRPDPGEIDLAAEIWAHERLIAARGAGAATPKPFSSDGCSGGMSVIWREMSSSLPLLQQQIGQAPPWEQCCIVHDRAYHNAMEADAAQASFDARLNADWVLRQCIVATGVRLAAEDAPIAPEFSKIAIEQTYMLIGDMVFSAVRVAGAPCSGLPWRWGYGYETCSPIQPAGN